MLVGTQEDDEVLLIRLGRVERRRAVLDDVPRSLGTDPVSFRRGSESDRYITRLLCQT